jgi:hypothetical protein
MADQQSPITQTKDPAISSNINQDINQKKGVFGGVVDSFDIVAQGPIKVDADASDTKIVNDLSDIDPFLDDPSQNQSQTQTQDDNVNTKSTADQMDIPDPFLVDENRQPIQEKEIQQEENKPEPLNPFSPNIEQDQVSKEDISDSEVLDQEESNQEQQDEQQQENLSVPEEDISEQVLEESQSVQQISNKENKEISEINSQDTIQEQSSNNQEQLGDEPEIHISDAQTSSEDVLWESENNEIQQENKEISHIDYQDDKSESPWEEKEEEQNDYIVPEENEAEPESQPDYVTKLLALYQEIQETIQMQTTLDPESPTDNIEVLGADNDKILILYRIYPQKKPNIQILKAELIKDTREQVEHTVAFVVDDGFSLLIDQELLYTAQDLDEEENVRMQLVDKINKFKFLVKQKRQDIEVKLKELEAKKENQQQAQKVFRNF